MNSIQKILYWEMIRNKWKSSNLAGKLNLPEERVLGYLLGREMPSLVLLVDFSKKLNSDSLNIKLEEWADAIKARLNLETLDLNNINPALFDSVYKESQILYAIDQNGEKYKPLEAWYTHKLIEFQIVAYNKIHREVVIPTPDEVKRLSKFISIEFLETVSSFNEMNLEPFRISEDMVKRDYSALREELKLSKKKVQEEIGLSNKKIQMYEDGTMDITDEDALKISMMFNGYL